VVGFLGVVTLLSRALALNRVVGDNYTATYLAAEGIEIAKNIIDANSLNGAGWNAGITNGDFEVDHASPNLVTRATGRFLLFDPATRRYSYNGSLVTPFVRKVHVDLVDGGEVEVRVTSEVSWETRGGAESSVTLEDHFYNWR
jgi:hypothetical protein